jgi:predicted acylesterase/phospholipase RssA
MTDLVDDAPVAEVASAGRPARAVGPDRSIALCLSGGGLRATLFHLGVIRAFRRAKRDGLTAIDAVTEVYSVSGGSILAAHMMANWDKYTGSEESFAEAERAIFDFADSSLRDRVLRRAITQKLWRFAFWFWPTRFSPAWSGGRITGSRRAHWLQEEYRSLLGSDSLADCARRFPGLPRFHILATSFRSAELCAFTNDGFEVEGRDESFSPGPLGSSPLSAAVAASSAFPPLFPPITFPASILHDDQSPRARGTILLSDGGIYDNLGVEKYRCKRVRDPRSTPARLVISDGGAAFRNDDVASFANVVGRNMRASDVLMDRVARATKEDVRGVAEIEDLVISIHPDERLGRAGGDHNPGGTPDDDDLYGRVRTDLDRFDMDLCTLLTSWGERAARTTLEKEGWAFEASAGGQALSAGHRSMLTAASERNLWSVFSSRRDGTWSWALRGTVLALLLLGVILPIAGVSSVITELTNRARAEERDKNTRVFNGQQAELIAGYSLVYKNIADALSNNDIAEAKRIISEKTGTLFDQTVQAQEKLARINSEPGADSATSSIAPSETPAAKVSPQRVYIQFAGTYTRPQITELNAALRKAGWDMQSSSGERTENANGRNEVRFGAGGQRAAEELAKAINSSSVRPGTPLKPVYMEIVGPRNLEVWMSN